MVWQVGVEVRQTLGRLVNCIEALSKHSIMLSPTSLMAAHDTSLNMDLAVSWDARPYRTLL